MRSWLCCLWLVLGHWYALWAHKHTCHGSYLQSEWRIRPGKQYRSRQDKSRHMLTLTWKIYFSFRTKCIPMQCYFVFLHPYRLNTFSLTRQGLWPAMSCSLRSALLLVSPMGTFCFFCHIPYLPPLHPLPLPPLSPSLNAECASQYIWRFSLLAPLLISNCISASVNKNYKLKAFGRKGTLLSLLQAFVHRLSCWRWLKTVCNIFSTMSWFKNMSNAQYPLDSPCEFTFTLGSSSIFYCICHFFFSKYILISF